jgi:hypothetical protein
VYLARARMNRIADSVFLAFILVAIILSAYFRYTTRNYVTPNQSQSTAAIIDQASLSPNASPNQTFIEVATNILKQAGYTVDYFSGNEITVDFYRNLATHVYKLIIFRVHSSAMLLNGTELRDTPVSFFTNEEYDTRKYPAEQLSGQLMIAAYRMPQPSYYFGITPTFVTKSMLGSFQNTVIVMMGCEGLKNTVMAEALVEKGASVYVGWKGTLSSSHTDCATANLLQHLIAERQTIGQAVRNTSEEVGPDPGYGSLLAYYPLQVENKTIAALSELETLTR